MTAQDRTTNPLVNNPRPNIGHPQGEVSVHPVPRPCRFRQDRRDEPPPRTDRHRHCSHWGGTEDGASVSLSTVVGSLVAARTAMAIASAPKPR